MCLAAIDIPGCLRQPGHHRAIGTGPFRFKEWARGDHLILERNPGFWDPGKPYLDRIVFRFIADSASRAAALEAGEAQLGALTPAPLSEMARLTATPTPMATTAGYGYMAPVLLLQLNLPGEARRVAAHGGVQSKRRDRPRQNELASCRVSPRRAVWEAKLTAGSPHVREWPVRSHRRHRNHIIYMRRREGPLNGHYTPAE